MSRSSDKRNKGLRAAKRKEWQAHFPGHRTSFPDAPPRVPVDQTLADIEDQIRQWEIQYARGLRSEGMTDRVAQAGNLLGSLKEQRTQLLANQPV